MPIPRHTTPRSRRRGAALACPPRALLAALLSLALVAGNAGAGWLDGHGDAVDPAADSLSSGRGGASGEPATGASSTPGARHAARYSIHDADADIFGDYDGDAFYRHLEVSFDADVDHDLLVEVYAELFLRRDGGAWLLYHVTEPFAIHASDAGDFYVVETELLEGYPPGYYDVAIDLYAPGRGLVASLDSADDADLRGLPLEDADYDYSYDYDYGGVSFGMYAGTGALGAWPALALLAALYWRRRVARRTAPPG